MRAAVLPGVSAAPQPAVAPKTAIRAANILNLLITIMTPPERLWFHPS
jgi:hypothetical protein